MMSISHSDNPASSAGCSPPAPPCTHLSVSSTNTVGRKHPGRPLKEMNAGTCYLSSCLPVQPWKQTRLLVKIRTVHQSARRQRLYFRRSSSLYLQRIFRLVVSNRELRNANAASAVFFVKRRSARLHRNRYVDRFQSISRVMESHQNRPRRLGIIAPVDDRSYFFFGTLNS
jgi:hypothetical protein